MDTKSYEKTISVKEYKEKYVNIEEFLKYCKQCPSYNKIWSCPPFEFDPEDYWDKYDKLYIRAYKFSLADANSREEAQELMLKVKGQMSDEFFQMEKEHPGSVSLSAGNCNVCASGKCSKEEEKKCRFPDKMRYSIESLGGNVGLTLSKLMGIELEWMEDGKLPEYYVLVGGLLYN